jgi:sporulation protein YlmC with PRC-barrel domain
MFGSNKDKINTRLRELSGSGFEIKKGQPDIRGWDVRDNNRHKIGKVRELIFDLRANKVRYMVIDILDVKQLDLEKRTVLVPIGMAELDHTDDDVVLPTVNPFQLRALPRYDKTTLGAKAERDISIVFGRDALSSHTPTASANQVDEDVNDDFYNHDHFNEDNMYRNRGKRDVAYRSEREREEETLRRQAELGTPVSDNEVYNKARREHDEDDNRNETDDEYYRRTGRRRYRL